MSTGETQATGASPAYRIETERVVVRCWNPVDAPLLKAAIDASLEHLLPWMPWARDEPEPLARKVARLRRFRGNFDLGNDYVYGIFAADESEVRGGCGLHRRCSEHGLEIGYWIHANHINRGLATEIAAALTRVAFAVHGMDRVEIHCDPENVRSAAVPRKLGYMHEVTLRRRREEPDGSLRDTMVWTLFADRYPETPSATAAIRAYGATGERLI